MKEILASVLLLAAVLLLYVAVAQGPQGTKAGLESFGSAMSQSIRSTDP
ncbi:hypothetical protein ACTHPH_12125 [Paenibacillus pasadenensis]|uniref:Uncharacterized protein n=1 Tax=Paenibacillus pasadenensis TaxID=217090 RepID=A0A2N5N3K9_9BACL|nr:hypothetical protein [Paenibacillus pasadenensis]PLT44892.1 hypothetical protein B8V81_3323 [Paenibacillus pasadenensis]